MKAPCRRPGVNRRGKGLGADCQISSAAHLIYLHSVGNCNEIYGGHGSCSGAHYRPSFSIAMNPLRFTQYHLSLMLHILEHVQLAEHWGGILCKFPNNKPTRLISLWRPAADTQCVCVCVCVCSRHEALHSSNYRSSRQPERSRSAFQPKFLEKTRGGGGRGEEGNNSFALIFNRRVSFRSFRGGREKRRKKYWHGSAERRKINLGGLPPNGARGPRLRLVCFSSSSKGSEVE